MRTLVITAALVAVLLGCAPRDPVTYAHVVCGDQNRGLMLGSDEHAACVQWLAKHPPGVLLAIGGGMLEPVTAAPDSYEN
jgi:hypothetical protein